MQGRRHKAVGVGVAKIRVLKVPGKLLNVPAKGGTIVEVTTKRENHIFMLENELSEEHSLDPVVKHV